MNDSRLKKLEDLLDAEIPDPFLLYAIAIEYKSGGEYQQAIDWFMKLLTLEEEHLGAHSQIAALYASVEEIDLAELYYRRGIEIAKKQGNAHMLSELSRAYTLLKEDE